MYTHTEKTRSIEKKTNEAVDNVNENNSSITDYGSTSCQFNVNQSESVSPNKSQTSFRDNNHFKKPTQIGTLSDGYFKRQSMLLQRKENKTGLSNRLKAGVENLSGYSMDDVRVHYNSGKPAQVGALAYTQGTDIHVAPGQRKYLPHEAWHVVQQKQGRVRPTQQLKGNIDVNDDNDLEKEADIMGTKSMRSLLPDKKNKRAVNRKEKIISKYNTSSLESQKARSGSLVPAVTLVENPNIQHVAQFRGHPLEAVLGDNSHNRIRSIVNRRNLMNVFTNDFLVAEARQLIAGNFSEQQAERILRILVREAGNQGRVTRGRQNSASMLAANVPFNLIREIMDNYNPLATQPGNTMVAFMTAVAGWGWASVDALLTAFIGGLPGFNLQRLVQLAGAVAVGHHIDAITFANTANYNPNSKITLARNFSTNNPNNFTNAQWVTLAGNAGNDQVDITTLFARIGGWAFADVLQTLDDFQNNNPRNLMANRWVALAGHVNTPANTAALAGLGGWSAAGKVALGMHFGNNAYGLSMADWIAIARGIPASNANRTREAAHYVSRGWPRSVAFNGANNLILPIGDGLMWGRGNPHITIHAINENTTRNQWRNNDRNYHVRRVQGGANVYDYNGPNRHFFNNVNMNYANWADGLANDFWNNI